MPQIQFIEDAYINEVIKTAGPYNPALNRTQGVRMRELIKLLRDRFEQEISSANLNLQNRLEKNQANGYAGLDNDGKLPSGLLPDTLLGNLRYRGVYDASSNTPTLPSADSAEGSYYIINVSGSYSGISFNVGDWIVSDGTFWSKVDNSDSVTTVFGRNGNVLANSGDYSTSQITEDSSALYFTNSRVQGFSDGRYSLLTHTHLWTEISDRPTSLSEFVNDIGPATTIFGRTGNIIAMAGDYNTALVTEDPSALYFTNARAQAFGDVRYSLLGHGHNWNEINNRPTNLSQFVNDIGPATTVFGRTGNIIATAGDYNTSLVTEHSSALYFTNSRVQIFADSRYALLGHAHNWNEINNRPTNLSQFVNDIGPATTVFGRTGDITAQAGDYNTALVTENPSALYFTNSRVQSFADGRYSQLGHGHGWGEISGKPTNLSQFANDLGNYGNWAQSNGGNSSGTWNISITGQASGLGNYAFNPQVLDSADYIFGRNGNNQINLISQAGLRGFLGLGSFAYRNGINGNEVYSEIANQSYDSGIAALLRWKNYGNNHVIFDASQGTSPTGTNINNVNAAAPWSPTYPSLMGWNGNNTYGLRVDSARMADNAGTWAGLGYVGVDTSVNNYLMGYGNDGNYHPIGVGNVRSFLGLQSNGEYHRYGGFGTDANTVSENTSSFTYANNAPFNGTLMHFGANGYGTQFNSPYGNGGGLAFRTRNGDGGSWNAWRNIFWNGYNLGPANFAGGSGKAYNTANIELYRDNDAPNISFHYGGVVASSITIEPSGRIAIMNNPGTGYEDLVARNLYASERLFATIDVTGAYTYGTNFVNGGRIWTGFDSGVAGSVSASAWFRSSGASGWYNETYGGGIFMQDSTYVRTHGDKQFYCNSNILAGGVFRGENIGSGLVGVYDPGRYQMVFSMGDAYRSGLDGTTLGNHYGIAWTHPNVGGQSIPGLSHQALFTIAGQTASAVGDGIWTRGALTVGGGQTSSVINMGDSDEGTRVIHCNSNRIGFLNQGGGWGSYCNDDGSWQSDSNMYAGGSISAAGGFYDTSDVRLKDVVEQDLDVSSIKAISYKWKDNSDGKIHVGYSAQDVEACLPFAVHTNEEGEKSVRYNEVLVAKIDALEKQLAELLRRVN